MYVQFLGVLFYLLHETGNKLTWICWLTLAPLGEGEYSLIWPIRGCAARQGMVFGLFVLNRVYNFVCVCQQGIPGTIDLICSMNFVYTPSMKKL